MKDLENRAQRLSGEATDESAAANTMLKAISRLEQELPSALKVGALSFPLACTKQGGLTAVLLHVQEDVDAMASMLRDLTGAASRSSQHIDSIQRGVEQNQTEAEKLLREGRASGQVPSALLFKPGLQEAGWIQPASSPPGAQGSSAGISSPARPRPRPRLHLQTLSRFLISRWRSCWPEQKLPERSPALPFKASEAALRT